MKKLMLGALAALCAMLALPAFASATPAHLDAVPEGGFTVHGGASSLSRVAGGGSTGTTTTGTGSFENTTTGTVSLTFHHVTTAGFTCTSAGQPAGTVKTATLPFHLVMLETGKPGILITPPADGGLIAHYACGIFVHTVEVKGNGVLGTITSPACEKSSTEATLSFTSNGAGVQNHLTYTGTNYTLESAVNTGSYSQSAMEAHATIKFAGARTLVCT